MAAPVAETDDSGAGEAVHTTLSFRLFGILRLIAAAVGIVALVANFQYVLGFSTFATVNYFSYFTQQSNLVNVVILVVSGVLTFRGRSDPRWFAALHAIVTCYVMVSGIVFAVIVSQSASHHYSLAFPPSSQVLHFWLAGYVLLDWVFAPGRTPVRWRTLWLVLVYPLVWGFFTLDRGRDVRWYPYFFLDPAQVSPRQFALYNGIVLVIFLAVLCGLIGLSRLRPSHLLRHRIASPPAHGAGLDDGVGVGDAVDGARSK
ncbi:hypothetical protein GCM10025867_42050 [Frondihabitans sucicola]|uniref:Integral membrane regulator n=1 Tax=Frondihabitans sucicola TaxID=1268041 RepID=A0ABN6Y3T4_9MICO|nr:Pr6Pr family membrane protein [Frondihabitans sucicola]BDZ51964.1 hypothetical protein GCM10025867_42050 [Frondihabitans sucicola]